MKRDDEDGLLAQCVKEDPRVLLSLFADFLTEDPEATSFPALALREQARAGRLDETYIPALAIALVDAPTLAGVIHLAKALAAFGRQAQFAATLVIDRLQQVQVTDDDGFWVLDGGLWALAYLGGPAVQTFTDSLDSERPSRVLRSSSVYRGELTDDERTAMFADTLAGVQAILAHTDDDAPRWQRKQTDFEKATAPAPKQRLAPWMTR